MKATTVVILLTMMIVMIMWMEVVILFRCVKLVIGHVRTATNSFQKMVQTLLQHIKQTLIFFQGEKVVQKKKKSLLSKMKKQVDISSSIVIGRTLPLLMACWQPSQRVHFDVRRFRHLHVRLLWIMNLHDLKGCLAVWGGEAVSCRAATEAGARRRFSSELIGTQTSEKTIWR